MSKSKLRVISHNIVPNSSENPRLLLLGTHHKTGTLWMERLLAEFSNRTGIPLIDLGYMIEFEGAQGEQLIPAKGRAILFSHDATLLTPELLGGYSAAGFHIIRDPRDVAISGAAYHSKPECVVGEPWLLEPFEGYKSYQAALLAQPSFEHRVLFEAKHIAQATSMAMVRVHEASFLRTLRYEDLVAANFRGGAPHAIRDTWRLSGPTWNHFRLAFNHTHLRSDRMNGHVQINNGSIEQWKKLPAFFREKINEVLGDLASRLGYLAGP
jgi:hypothetical protein